MTAAHPPDQPLDEADLGPDPIAGVERWVREATDAGLLEPTAMQIATVDGAGKPSVRTVLLRGIDPRGFRFYTNYESRKGRALAEDPRAAFVLLWKELGRQINVTGTTQRLSQEESTAYFAARPRGHRLGAWASSQSRPVATRDEMEAAYREVEGRFDGVDDVPLPPYWGGFLLRPDTVEFWRERRNRMHDRFRFTRTDDGWRRERLWP